MTQPERLSHAQRTDRSDRLMLEAAIQLIVQRGTDKTTLKEVGEHAGYSRGLAGYRFGSKAGLFEFIVRSIGEQWLEDLMRVTAGKSGLAAIEAAIDEHCRFCIEASDAVRAYYILWFESIGVQSPVKDVIAGIHERRRHDLIQWIRSANTKTRANAEAIAGQFNAAILGIAYQWLTRPDDAQSISGLHRELRDNMRSYFYRNDSTDDPIAGVDEGQSL